MTYTFDGSIPYNGQTNGRFNLIEGEERAVIEFDPNTNDAISNNDDESNVETLNDEKDTDNANN